MLRRFKLSCSNVKTITGHSPASFRSQCPCPIWTHIKTTSSVFIMSDSGLRLLCLSLNSLSAVASDLRYIYPSAGTGRGVSCADDRLYPTHMKLSALAGRDYLIGVNLRLLRFFLADVFPKALLVRAPEGCAALEKHP